MNLYFSRKFPGGALPFKRLMGCAAGWGSIFTTGLTMIGSHFQQSYQNGVAHFRIFGVRKFFIFPVRKRTRKFVLQVESKVFFIQFIKKWVNSFQDDLYKGLIRQVHKQKVTKLGSRKLHICPKVTKMWSTAIGHKIDYNGDKYRNTLLFYWIVYIIYIDQHCFFMFSHFIFCFYVYSHFENQFGIMFVTRSSLFLPTFTNR